MKILVSHRLFKWDFRFLRVAREVSMWSKDPSCKVGCVFASPERRILVTGYNGLPRGIDDSRAAERKERDENDHLWFEHAERNGIFNAAYEGVSLRGSHCYTMELPCAPCARAIIQCGVIRVVLASPMNDYAWTDPDGRNGHVSRTMFREAGVVLVAPEKRLLLMQEDA